MAVELIIAPEAMTDLEQAYAWYESQSVGRGDDFLIRVDASFAAIIKLPDLHPRVRAN